MERIQEAIEKKQADSESVEQLNASYSPEGNNKQTDQLPTIDSFSSKSTSAIHVEYTKTKHLNLSDEELKSRHLVAGLAHDSRSEPYRQLRSQILKKMRDEGWRSLAITSPTHGNGKTLTALNLAISLSQEVNQTVMLVDLDLRNPGVAKTLGVENTHKGIVDSIMGDTPLEEILINPGYNRLVIAPGTPQGNHTSEILSSPSMKQLQSELYHRYEDRIIIFDLPALLDSDDALVFAPSSDATLLVVEDGGSKKEELERAVHLLRDCNLVGTVINKVR